LDGHQQKTNFLHCIEAVDTATSALPPIRLLNRGGDSCTGHLFRKQRFKGTVDGLTG
jgi:hypothetical protein